MSKEKITEALMGAFYESGLYQGLPADEQEAEFTAEVVKRLSAQGLVIVPRVSTPAMYEAGDAIANAAWHNGHSADADDVWTTMLDAYQPKGE